MTPALPPAAALGWLATVTPGLRAAALLDGDGRLVAGDPSLAGSGGAREGDVRVARGRALTLAARVSGAPLRGLLEADLAATLAAAEGGRSA